MSRVNSISGEIVILYDTSYALYKVYHALNPLRIYVVSDTRKGPRHIGFHWGHETFCWKSAEMSHHDSILRDIRKPILLAAHRLEMEAQRSFSYPRMDIGNHPFAIYLCWPYFGGRRHERSDAFCHGEHDLEKPRSFELHGCKGAILGNM
ncbi:hypothetical protein BGY98DRAFT_84736 [Russula aff. rugulosa BPL654]|nr:hypothetical protein BGY98DRAFT_84736 [Russula aff. rugulosa BPL654]